MTKLVLVTRFPGRGKYKGPRGCLGTEVGRGGGGGAFSGVGGAWWGRGRGRGGAQAPGALKSLLSSENHGDPQAARRPCSALTALEGAGSGLRGGAPLCRCRRGEGDRPAEGGRAGPGAGGGSGLAPRGLVSAGDLAGVSAVRWLCCWSSLPGRAGVGGQDGAGPRGSLPTQELARSCC